MKISIFIFVGILFIGVSESNSQDLVTRNSRLVCGTWLRENFNGYISMVEGYLFGLYHYQSLMGNPSGSFAIVSSKELPQQVVEECRKNSYANVGEIALSIKSQLDAKNGQE